MRISTRVKASGALINPLTKREFNNAFSHSQQCDGYFSKNANEHRFCQCWCHIDINESLAPFGDTEIEPEGLHAIAEAMRQTEPEPEAISLDLDDLIDSLDYEPDLVIDPVCDTCGDAESICECVE